MQHLREGKEDRSTVREARLNQRPPVLIRKGDDVFDYIVKGRHKIDDTISV